MDPVHKTRAFLSDLLTALTAGLAFVAAPELGILSTAADALVQGLQLAPSVAKAIWPEGTENSQSIQLGQLDTELTDLYANYSRAIQNGLTLVMTDVPSFVAFASSGNFSGPNFLSLPSDADALTLAWNTYILSTALTANKWKSYAFRDLDRADIESNVPGGQGWDCTFGNDSVCTNEDSTVNVFYSDSTGTAYTLFLDGTGPNPGQLMHDIVDKHWSSLEMLFDGAYNCTVAGNIGKPLSFLNDSSMDLSCMSQLDMDGDLIKPTLADARF